MCRDKWLSAVKGMLSATAIAFPARAAIVPPPSPAVAGKAFGDLRSPYAARTGAAFVAACGSDQAGCDGKIGDVLISRMQFSPTMHLCLPGPSYAAAVAPWLKAHPETSNMTSDEAIASALSALYKCGPPNNY